MVGSATYAMAHNNWDKLSRRVGRTVESSRQDENELVARAKEGDRGAFSALCASQQDALYRIALASVRQPELSRDLVQDTFLKAWRAWPQFRGNTSSTFAAWLNSILQNKVRDYFRALKRRPRIQHGAPNEEGAMTDPLKNVTDTSADERFDEATYRADLPTDRILIDRLKLVLNDAERLIVDFFLSEELSGVEDRARRMELVEDMLRVHGQEALVRRLRRGSPKSVETTFRAAVRKMRSFAKRLGLGNEGAR